MRTHQGGFQWRRANGGGAWCSTVDDKAWLGLRGGAAALDVRQSELGLCGGDVAQELLFKAGEATWGARQGAEAWR